MNPKKNTNTNNTITIATIQILLEKANTLLEGQILLQHASQNTLTPTQMHAWPDQHVNTEITQRYHALLAQHLQGTPIAYIVGYQPFYDLNLNVSKHTLIPRPETECMVEYVLQYFSAKKNLHILDLGTGSGAIAIVLAKHNPHWHITATDICLNALAIAQINAEQYQCLNLHFMQSDWFEKITGQQYDLIISNPPYIDTHDPYIEKTVRQYEPHTALFANESGLQDIRCLIEQAPQYLRHHGHLLLEHGFQQKSSIQSLLKKHPHTQATYHQDLNKLDRWVDIQF